MLKSSSRENELSLRLTATERLILRLKEEANELRETITKRDDELLERNTCSIYSVLHIVLYIYSVLYI